jgi:glycosyltransferase involved in cell wall biosynthesis
LFDYFLRYKANTHDPVKLVLIGSQMMPVPRHPDIVALGFVSDEERFRWLGGAQAFVMPSPFESLSLATLEAWALGVPVVVTGQCEVLKGHCKRSRGGLYYHTPGEFGAALSLLRTDADLRRELGERGRTYVQHHYNWRMITTQYLAFLQRVYALIHH